MHSGKQTKIPRSHGIPTEDWHVCTIRVLSILFLVLMCSRVTFAYSVLSHEEIVDLLWKDEISPLLLKRYPGVSEEQLKEAVSSALLALYEAGQRDPYQLARYGSYQAAQVLIGFERFGYVMDMAGPDMSEDVYKVVQ